MAQARGHLDRHGPGHNHEIGLAGTGPKDLRAEAGHIVLWGGGSGDHLKAAASQRVHKGPDGTRTRPVLRPMEHVSDAGQHRMLFLLAGRVVLRSFCHAQRNRLASLVGWGVFLFSMVLLVTHLPVSFLLFSFITVFLS